MHWHPLKRCPAFLVGRTQFFGGKSCPVNFARVPDWCCHALASIAGLATSHCVDDVLAVDRKTTIFSGWLVWRVLAACCGWVVPDEKSPLPSQVHRILGATSDLSQTPYGPPTLSIAQDRVAQLTSMISDVLESGSLNPAIAGKLWDRLEFSCTQMFGRFGRAKLRPFSRRQHEHCQYWLNHQLTSALKWWLEILSCSPPRLVPTDLSARRRLVSYSDGEGSEAGIGVALWENETQVARASVLRVPEEVRILWDHQKNLGRFSDIFEIEAVGPLILLENFPDLFRGSLWLHFLDNAAALSNLVNGSSSVIQGDILIGATWSQVQRLQVFPCFDRLDSKSNPGKSSNGERALEPTRCWLLIREGGSTSEHRDGLSAVVPVFPSNTWEPPLLTWVV